MFFNCCNNPCNRCCCDCCPRSCDPCGFCPIGPRGPVGPIGPTGPTGPTGPDFNTFGSFYESAAQVITTGVPVTLTSTISASNLAIAANSVFIPTTGTYLIQYGINAAPGAVAGNNIFLAVNGVAVAGTQRSISVSAGTNSTAILNLTAGQFVSIMPTAAAVAVSNVGGVSANLSITQIS